MDAPISGATICHCARCRRVAWASRCIPNQEVVLVGIDWRKVVLPHYRPNHAMNNGASCWLGEWGPLTPGLSSGSSLRCWCQFPIIGQSSGCISRYLIDYLPWSISESRSALPDAALGHYAGVCVGLKIHGWGRTDTALVGFYLLFCLCRA